MEKQLIATRQVTVITQKDSYTLNQSVSEYVFTAQSNGAISAAVSFSSIIKVTLGDLNITDFTIDAVTKPAGFSAITVNNTNKTITYSVAAGTTTLADSGLITIPIVIAGVTYQVSFVWSKAKAGPPGSETNMLDWIQDWNSNKTTIGSNSVITPKIFAGVKNTNDTITGTAIGRFSLSTLNASGSVTTEIIDGVYGFKDGRRTFSLDNTGNVQLGGGNQYIKYNATTGQVEFGSDVSLAWIGATYIDANGVFTGTLSADTIEAFQLNASQIVAGTINAALIDVVSLKASLITTENIEALTLNVVRGEIGGWSIDSDSIYRGTKNNTDGIYTFGSGSITIGSNGIRGVKWRLDSTGAGAVADGNISWDANGNVTFGSSVMLNWQAPINSVVTALGGSSYPKLTQISSTGIYTGTLTAAQINAVSLDAESIKVGTLNADRIAANSLSGNKIVARTISADRILTGTITANEIASQTITAAKIVSGTITANEINVSNIQACIVTAEVVNGLTCTFVRGTIAGWVINSSQIYKGNVYLGNDGTISNSTKWIFRNDGSGQLANGAIAWNTAGAVTFSSTVSLNWTNAAANALNSAKSYADTKKNEAISSASTDATNKANAAKEFASAMAFGRMLYRDPTFWNGSNSINAYNNSGNGTVTVTRTADSNAPNDSKYVLLIKNTGSASPYCGGFHFGTDTSYRKIFITRIIAKIPSGRNLSYNSNSIGSGGSQKWLTPVVGTGDWYEYVCKVICGTANFSSTHFFAIDGNVGSTSTPVEWRVAYATVFDVTSTEKYTTTIDANGIYTSSLNANQITAGTISSDRIATGSLNGNKITARTISADRIVTGAITANEIAGNTITASKIAARTITADRIATGVITANEIASGTITAAKIVARTITADRIVSGAITANEIASKTITAAEISAGTITSVEINTGSIQAAVVTAGAVNGLTCTFSKGKIGGFTISETAMFSINVTPGHNVGIQSNGYMYNCNTSNISIDYWALMPDGSALFGTGKIKFGANGDGWLANKNITWDVNGNVSITGTITAKAGSVAGFSISGDSLVNKNANAKILLNNLAGQSFVRINESTSSSLIGIRTDVANRTGLSISTYASGATGLYIINNVNGGGAIKSYGGHTFGQRSGEIWNAPGVLYIGSKTSVGQSASYKKIWGDGGAVTSSSHLGNSKYKFFHNLGHSEYTVIAQTSGSSTHFGSYRLIEKTSSYFIIQNLGYSGSPDTAPFDFIIYGRNKI